jgi:hypothetical protein
MLNKFTMCAALAVSIVTSFFSVQPAHASTLSFELSGADNYSWLLDSNPTNPANNIPDSFSLYGTSTPNYIFFASVPGLPANYLSFYTDTVGGGLSAGSLPGDGGTNIFNLFGEQFFTYTAADGDLTHIQFRQGTFVLGSDTLTIGETPLPSTWLLMLSGLVGLGFFAYGGTTKRPAGLAAA